MKRIVIIIISAVAVCAAAYAVYGFCLRKSISRELSTSEQVQAILEQNNCYVCHSASPQLPFYSKLPIIGPVMKQHVEHAQSFTDLQATYAAPEQADEVAVSMLEHSVNTGAMPIHQYRMIHWGTGLNAKEKSILSEWIKNMRLQKFANGLSSEEFAAEAVQCVPGYLEHSVQKAELGQRMYNDGRLSHDGTLSCASCHLLEEGGADHQDERTSEGIYGQFGTVNAPTVYNAVLNVRQFWNGRAADLQEQAAAPPTNPIEMGSADWNEIVERLSQDKALVKEFETLYPGEGLTASTVTDAIAEYEKTLLTPDSRFDLYLKGDKTAITEQELAGYESFKENACATCHTGANLGGKSFEKLGIFGSYYADRDSSIQYCSDDDGLKGFTQKESDLHKFKVPGLRNIELTAPYFHDGTIMSLEGAVKAMAKYELGKNLKDDEIESIVLFMKTLNGKTPYRVAQ